MTKKRKLSPVAQVGSEEGNTIPPLKRISSSKRWCFTYCNYPDNWMAQMAPLLDKCLWVAEHEIGDGTDAVPLGTPHIQGYVEFPIKVRPIGYKGCPKEVHWEKCKGTRDHNVNYCTKDYNDEKKDTTEIWGNLKPKIDMTCTNDDVMTYDELFDWGKDLVDLVNGRLPDKKDRRIFWYYSKEGQRRKTETARYLVHYHDAIVIQGGRKHVLATAYKNPAPIYILCVPRCDEGFVSYASIELLKDNLYMSAFGTEATGMVNRKKPWVVVLANFDGTKDVDKMSEDRWITKCVDSIGQKNLDLYEDFK